MIVLIMGVCGNPTHLTVPRRASCVLRWGFVIKADNNDGLSAGKQLGRIGAFFNVSVHPGHLAGVAGVKPIEKAIDVFVVDGRGIGNTDEVKPKLKGLLLYLFSQSHFYYYIKIRLL